MTTILIASISMLILLLGSALISGSEVAYFSLSPQHMEALEQSPGRRNKLALKLLQEPKRLLATILITNNFINVGIVIISSILTAYIAIPPSWPSWMEFAIHVGAVTFLILLVGEVIPKVYATKNPLRLARLMAFVLYTLDLFWHYTLLSRALISFTSVLDSRVKKKSYEDAPDELGHALELTKEDEISADEQKMLKGIVQFGNTDVKQIMTSRVDVIAFEQNLNYTEVISQIIDCGYSRIPVYKESFDQIVGVIYIKDLLPHLEAEPDFEWQSLIRQPYFVPENKKIDDLLNEFQEKKIHLAVVVDEYGGTLGIVTMEDVIEEIIGDIADEFDDDELVYSKLDEENYIFEGKTPLVDLYKVLDINGQIFEENKGESDTIAGFILEQTGKIPLKNEKVNFEQYIFTIEASDKRKIKRVKITIKEHAKTENS